MTGSGHFLSERKPGLQIVGADPIGSIYSSEQVHSYLVEGVGEDFWPTTFDRDVVDRWIRVSDREAFAATRRVAREEGILIGASGGMALQTPACAWRRSCRPTRPVLVILPDGGRPYLSKVFNDDWMLVHGMFDDTAHPPSADELGRRAQRRRSGAHERGPAAAGRGCDRAAAALRRVAAPRDRRGGDVVGCVHERTLLDHAMRDGRGALESPTAELMSEPLPVAVDAAPE